MTVTLISDLFSMIPRKDGGSKATKSGKSEGGTVLELRGQAKNVTPHSSFNTDKEYHIRKDYELPDLIKEAVPQKRRCLDDGQDASDVAYSVIGLMTVKPSECRDAQAEQVTSSAVDLLL